jgi:hypothetical protein
MTHIVFFKLKNRNDQDALLDILNKLTPETVPMARSFETGKDFLHSGRSLDAALIVRLDKEDLEAYANDPWHCRIKEEMAPLLEGTFVVDFD